MGPDLLQREFNEAGEGFGSPEDVPATAIDKIVHAIRDLKNGTRPSFEIVNDVMAVIAYLWMEFTAKPTFGAGLATGETYTGDQVLAELEKVRDGKPVEAVPVGVILQFLWAFVKLIKR